MLLITFLISGMYLLLMWNYLAGWLACAEAPKPLDNLPKVTVIVPARNEARCISACLQSIANQEGLNHLPDVIVVDDHSTDKTVKIVAELATTLQDKLSISLLHLHDSPETDLSFKKRALSYAIGKASTDVIITTDADCIACKHWLATITSYYTDHQVTLVTGPVLFTAQNNLLSQFQALDFCGTMGLTAAGIHQGWQHLANGANMSFRKTTWQQFGYKSNGQIASGDDMFLIQEVAEALPGSIRFAKSADAVVWTPPEPTWASFIQQRLRWGTKSSAYKEWQTQAALSIAWLMSLSILFSGFMLLVFSYQVAALAFFILVVTKALADFPILWYTTRYFGQQKLMRWFVPSLILHTLYIVLIGTLSMLVKQYTWKGRKTK
jgi:cellulose synthase/poly-beta-1,6-N-acetylglucosamine synthase-like glycosyltransferase